VRWVCTLVIPKQIESLGADSLQLSFGLFVLRPKSLESRCDLFFDLLERFGS
jgi:hypothetical protein